MAFGVNNSEIAPEVLTQFAQCIGTNYRAPNELEKRRSIVRFRNPALTTQRPKHTPSLAETPTPTSGKVSLYNVRSGFTPVSPEVEFSVSQFFN